MEYNDDSINDIIKHPEKYSKIFNLKIPKDYKIISTTLISYNEIMVEAIKI